MPSPDFCYSCGRDEPVPPSGVYSICVECGHAYVTEQDLVDLYNEAIAAMNKRLTDVAPLAFQLSSRHIYHCPLCLHDF
ncbi:hypothetical protein SAMN05216275_10527 [Streptosporangium canum]|uniref:Uncharacterized protein n=1 Tax=Streptosporangium canum TaxID=324952 RepID=A0A1I3L6A7_9ACTN|nr:hypothetical protein [Streptosporangium canum]SFI80227.1 hypothetical protein SAMN05216275_10527 [Streptosporangium canum]